MNQKSRLHLIIYGKVQGVFYRVSAQERAQSLGVTGRIKNMPNGTVEMILEGNRESLEEFLAWCYDGPDLATVSNIDSEWLDYKGEFNDIDIPQN